MARLSVSSITVGELAANCWFLTNEETKETLVFDPGDEAERIRVYTEKMGWTVKALILTHGHLDHMGAAEELKKTDGSACLCHESRGTAASGCQKKPVSFYCP